MEKTKSINTIFSYNLSSLMKEKKKTRKEVCADLDIKYTTFCDWINGRTIPKAEQIDRLSDYFCVSSSDFFIESKPMDSGEMFMKRMMTYSQITKELPMKALDSLTDNQIKELINSGFHFQHKTLEEYIQESGGEFVVSEELDWGEPVGREVW